MIGNGSYPRLVFEYGFDERAAFEARSRGYQSHVVVEVDAHTRYRVTFYDPVRLRQDLEEEVRSGRPFLAEPGMIVVPEVTEDHMRRAVTGLYNEQFFRGLTAVTAAP